MISVSMAKRKRGCVLPMNEAVIGNKKLGLKRVHNIGVVCSALMCGVFLAGCSFMDKAEPSAAESDELSIAATADTSETEGQNEQKGNNSEESQVNDTSDMVAATETQERSDTTVLMVMKEGMPEEIPATLYKGEGYSVYLPDGDWDNFEPDAWQAEKNNQVHFDVGNYEGLNKSQVEKILTEQGYVVENGELWMQDSDIMRRAICYETESDVWTVNFAYPCGEAEGGWLPVMRAMAETFAVDAG